nr:MGC13053 protein [Homo sapiens]
MGPRWFAKRTLAQRNTQNKIPLLQRVVY